AFMDDVHLSHGKSGSVSSGYGESTNRESSEFRAPVAFTNRAYRNVERLKSFLSRREKALLMDLLQDSLQGTSALRLETIGLINSGYSDKDQARTAGVVHVQTLLSRLADFYQI